MLAYDYPIAGSFWSLMFFAIWALWVFTVIWCFVDNFRSKDRRGLAKGLWFLAIILFPIVGVFAYLVALPFPHDDERL